MNIWRAESPIHRHFQVQVGFGAFSQVAVTPRLPTTPAPRAAFPRQFRLLWKAQFGETTDTLSFSLSLDLSFHICKMATIDASRILEVWAMGILKITCGKTVLIY